MKQVNLSLETAKMMYKEGNAVKAFALEHYTESELNQKELPKTWEELESIKGYYLTATGRASNVVGNTGSESNKQVFVTKEQAEASIAMAQLSQLIDVYNDGWIPNWHDNLSKYCIYMHNCELVVAKHGAIQRFLTFKSKEIAQMFFENFKDLIEQSKPLL